MFSIQFCICFYSILYVCYCHFTAIKLETNLDIRNRIEAIVSQNKSAVKYIAKNESNIYVGIPTNNQQQTTTKHKYNRDNRVKIVIPEKIKVTEKKNAMNNIDKVVIKKNYSIFGIDLLLYNLGNEKHFVTKKIINTDDCLENSIKKRKQSEFIDTGELTIPKNYTVKEQNILIENENITENVTNIFQTKSMDKNIPKYDLPKNIKNNFMTKDVHEYDSRKHVKQRSELIQGTGAFNIPKKNIVKEQRTIIKNENITENVIKNIPKNVQRRTELIEDTGEITIPKSDIVEETSTAVKNDNKTENLTNIIQNIGTDKNVQKHYLSKNTENNDMTKNLQKYDSLKNVKQLSELIEGTGEFTIPKSDTVEEQSTTIKNENITENITKIFQHNGMDKNVQNHESHKNVQKRDIGMPENAANNYMPEVFQNRNAKNDQKYDLHKTIENYVKPKNIHHNFNDVKPYNNHNDEINYKNIIYEKDVPTKDKHIRRYDDNTSQYVKPQFQTRLNNDLVKKSLSEFKMVRRKTHYTMPPVEFKNDIAKVDRYQDLTYTKFREYYSKAKLNGERNHFKPDYHFEDVRNNMYPSYSNLNHIYQSYEDRNEIQFFKELNKIIARQKEIIKKVEKKKRTVSDFDKLMSEVEAKQNIHTKLPNYTKFTFEIITVKTTPKLTTTAKPTTILTLFDETEVRHALKNDPHVKRILKMANLKREKYLNNVRRYLTRHNYTQAKEYAKNLGDGDNGLRTEAAGTVTFID